MNLKNQKIALAIIISISILICTAIIIDALKNKVVFSCETELNILTSENDSAHVIATGVIYNNNSGILSYKGLIENQEKKYIINRVLPFRFSQRTDSNVMLIKYSGPIKKKDDTTPKDSAWNTLYNKGEEYYISLYRTESGEYIIKERGTPSFICSR